MKNSSRHAWTIFCEDIRQEVGNKNSYMGIYNSEMFFEKMPAYLPKLCIIANCETDIGNQIRTLSSKVFLNDDLIQEQVLPPADLAQIQESIKMRDTQDDPIRKITIGISYQFLGLMFEKASIVKVVMYVDDEEIVAGKLRVKINTDTPALK